MILLNHGGNDSPEKALNRLFRKVPALRSRRDLPTITAMNSEIQVAQREKQELISLLQPEHVTAKSPYAADDPIVTISFEGTEYLIDGQKRLKYWQREREVGLHSVLCVEVII